MFTHALVSLSKHIPIAPSLPMKITATLLGERSCTIHNKSGYCTTSCQELPFIYTCEARRAPTHSPDVGHCRPVSNLLDRALGFVKILHNYAWSGRNDFVLCLPGFLQTALVSYSYRDWNQNHIAHCRWTVTILTRTRKCHRVAGETCCVNVSKEWVLYISGVTLIPERLTISSHRGLCN